MAMMKLRAPDHAAYLDLLAMLGDYIQVQSERFLLIQTTALPDDLLQQVQATGTIVT